MGNKDTTTRSTTAPNQDAMAQYQSLLQRAQGVANTPYQAYTGDLTAGINSQQQMGIGNINANAGFAMPYIQQAAQYANQAAQPISAADIQRYSDPFTQQVIQATQNQFQNANAQQQQGVVGNAASQGALGGDRVGVAQAELAGQQQRAQAPVIAGLESQGYNTGLQTALNQQQQRAQAAYSLGNLGVAGQNAALTGANAQVGAGSLMQGTEQQRLNAMYQQFQMQQAFPYQQTQWLAGLDTGVGSQMGGTSTTTPPPPNPWNTVAGLGMAGVGAFTGNPFMVAGGLGTAAKGFSARGGRISGFADGGAPTMPYADVSSWIPGSQITHGQGAPKPPGVGQPTAGVQKMVSDASAMANAMKRPPGGPMQLGQSFTPAGVGAMQGDVPSPEMGFGDGPIYRDGGIVNLPTTDRIMLPRGYDMGGTPTMAGFGGSMIPQSFGHTGNYQQVASSGVAPPGTVAPGAVTGPGGLDQTGVMPGGGVAGPYNGGIVPPDLGGPYLGGMGKPDQGGPYLGGMANNDLDRPPGMVTGAPIDQGGWGNGVPDTRPLPPRDPGGIVPPGFDQAPGMVTGQPMTMGQPAQPPTGQPLPTQIGFPGSSSAGSGNMMGGSGRARGGFADGGSDDSLNPRNWLGFQTEDGGGGTFDPMTDRPPSAQKRPLAGFEDLPPEITGEGSSPLRADPSDSAGVGALALADPEGPSGGSTGQSGFGGPGLGQALMAAGFKMMSSRSPYFGVAAGEAGEAGLGAYTAGQTRALAEKRAEATMARQAEQSAIQRKSVELRAKQLEQEAERHAADLRQRTEFQNRPKIEKGMDEFGRPNFHLVDPVKGTIKKLDPEGAEIPTGAKPTQGPAPSEIAGAFYTPPRDNPVNSEVVEKPIDHPVNDEVLAKLDPRMAREVKALAEGRLAPPTGRAASTPYWQERLARAVEYDPQFDAINYGARSAALKDVTSGPTSRIIRPLNTTANHMAEFYEAAKDLDGFKSGSLGPATKTANEIRTWFNEHKQDPRIRRFNSAVTAVTEELEKAFKGSNPAVSGIAEWRKSMSPSSSPEELNAATRTFVKLLHGQLDSVTDQYRRAFGSTRDALEFLSPQARSTFERLEHVGERPDTERKPAGAAKPQTVTQGGHTYTLQPDGSYK